MPDGITMPKLKSKGTLVAHTIYRPKQAGIVHVPSPSDNDAVANEQEEKESAVETTPIAKAKTPTYEWTLEPMPVNDTDVPDFMVLTVHLPDTVRPRAY
jgi:hypothetical protein